MTPPLRIDLPFPPSELSPNARLHWRALDRAKKAYKGRCDWELAIQPRPIGFGTARIPLLITITPPDRRKRDRDNLQHSLKYALDRLADYMGVDDYLFDPTYRFAEPEKPGRITIDLHPHDSEGRGE